MDAEGIVADHFEFGRGQLFAKLLVGGSQGGLLVDGGTTALATILSSSASALLTHDWSLVALKSREG